VGWPDQGGRGDRRLKGVVEHVATALDALRGERVVKHSSLLASIRQIAVRTELYQIQTLTISDPQFLIGDAKGVPVTISGQFRIAQGTGRLPVVVLQHGSSGYGANIDVWSRELNELGISTFALDGFTGRGLIEVNTNQSLLGRLNFILDIYRSLEVLGVHSRVDPGRIALMGFSRGGQAALYAALKRFHRLWNKSAVELCAYLSFYPNCMTTYLTDSEIVDRPIRIFGGALDDYNPISACRRYAERLRVAGYDVEVVEYRDASHAFDKIHWGRDPQQCLPNLRACATAESASILREISSMTIPSGRSVMMTHASRMAPTWDTIQLQTKRPNCSSRLF
jgi:dienelactone hydrolase